MFAGKNVLTLEVPCFKSLDPVHVVNALNCGFDGVMAVVCSSQDCKLQEGRATAERNLGVMLNVLKKKGLLDRFELYEESPRCAGDFNEKLDAFYKKDFSITQKRSDCGGDCKTYKIVTKKELVPKIQLFEVEAPDIAAKSQAGQFLIVVNSKEGERIPLTICGYDTKKGTVSFAFHEVGKTTKSLGLLNQGECIDNVTGPLGNPSEVKNFGKVLCVGGSVMIAPLLLQAKAMKEAGNKVTTILGAQNKRVHNDGKRSKSTQRQSLHSNR